MLGLEHGCPEVGDEFITQAHDEEPNISSHLRSCNEKAPGNEKDDSINDVVNISEPEEKTCITKVKIVPNTQLCYLKHTCLPGCDQQIKCSQA